VSWPPRPVPDASCVLVGASSLARVRYRAVGRRGARASGRRLRRHLDGKASRARAGKMPA
jgi:hypothetical protein